MLVDDNSWGGNSIWTSKVKCPDCDYDYVAIKEAYKVPRHMAIEEGSRYSKGSQQVLRFQCEQGHTFEIVFAFHKGQTFVGSEAVVE